MKKLVLALVFGVILVGAQGSLVFAETKGTGEHPSCKKCEEAATGTEGKSLSASKSTPGEGSAKKRGKSAATTAAGKQ